MKDMFLALIYRFFFQLPKGLGVVKPMRDLLVVAYTRFIARFNNAKTGINDRS